MDAGNSVRDQIASIIAAAESKSESVARESSEAAMATLEQATQAADRVLQLLRSLERAVEDLRRAAAREGDALRGTIEKSRRRGSDSAGVIPLPSDPPDMDTKVKPEIGPAPQEIAEESREGGEVGGGEEQPVAPTASRAEPGLNGEAPRTDDSGDPSADLEDLGDEEEARRRVEGKSDGELADIYAIATKAQVDARESGDVDKATRWETLSSLVVEEAARRSSFDAGGHRAEGRETRRKRQEVKRLKRLSAARDDLLSSGGS